MSRVAILTLPLSDNYGGILQAAALYRVLELLGEKPILINKKSWEPLWKSFLIYFFRRVPFQNYKNFRSSFVNSNLHSGFIDSYLSSQTEQAVDGVELRNLLARYDIKSIVVGSDQVWRLAYIDKKYYLNYFLDFADGLDVKKISYAASFGVEAWTDMSKANAVSNCLQKMHSISVREDSGVSICRTLGVTNAEHVMDPTMLVGADFYSDMIGSHVGGGGKGIVSYVLDKSIFTDSILNGVKKAVGDAGGLCELSGGGSKFQTLTIPEWVVAIRNANFVVTDSFHGTVFSIIFKKPFVVVCNKGRGASRFLSLLRKLGLESRMFMPGEDTDVLTVVRQPIDYSRVEKVIDEWRLTSLNFLRNALM